MTHNIVHIKASPKQMSKLRNGHKVRISPAMEGQGCALIIHPNRFDTVSKSFNRGKGTEVQLSPEEILVNQQNAPQMNGMGIFGERFDNMVHKTIGKKAKDLLYNTADKLKPHLKKAIKEASEYAPEIGASALSSLALASGNPELLPLSAIGGHRIGSYLGNMGSHYAGDFLDNPKKYYESNAGGPRSILPHTLEGQVEYNKLLDEMNQHLGTKAGVLARANLQNTVAHMRRANMNKQAVDESTGMSGFGFHKREVASIGIKGGFIGSQTHLPPALISQPFSSNFQFQHTLPPAYQKFSKGGGLYA